VIAPQCPLANGMSAVKSHECLTDFSARSTRLAKVLEGCRDCEVIGGQSALTNLENAAP